MKLDPGQIIDGRFAITTRLGGNQYSSTAKAETVGEGKEVVLKLLRRDENLDLQIQLAEAQAIQAFSRRCPELLTIEEVGVDHENVFQRLPFLPLRSLKRHPLPANDSDKRGTGGQPQSYFVEDFQWLVRVANALEFMSQQGRVHGDVKPTNILFSEDNRGNKTAWLSDVEIDSLGEPSDNKKVKDEYPGTLQYVSQEVFIDRTASSAKSDQYALAVTLYQWLSGELPFKGTTGIEMYKAFKAGCRPIDEHCPSLPSTAASAIHRALSVEPEDRFGSSKEFVDAFIEELPSRSFSLGTLPWKQLVGWVPVVAAMVLAGFFFTKAAQNMLSRKDNNEHNAEVIAKTPDPQNETDKPNQQDPKLVVNDQPGKGIPVVQRQLQMPQNGYQGNAIEDQSHELEKDDHKPAIVGSQDDQMKRALYEQQLVARQEKENFAVMYERLWGKRNLQSALASYEKAQQGSPEAQLEMALIYQEFAIDEQSRIQRRDPEACEIKQQQYDEVARRWYRKSGAQNQRNVQERNTENMQQQQPNAWPESKPQPTQPPRRRWNQQPPQQNYPQQNYEQ